MLLDEVNQAVDGIVLGDIHLDALLALIQADASCRGTDVAVVGVGHFARSVDDTAHDTDFQVFEVGRRLLHAVHCRLQVKHRPAAARARDELRLADALTRRLQDGKGIAHHLGMIMASGSLQPDAVGTAVQQHGTQVGTRLDLQPLAGAVGIGVGHSIPENIFENATRLVTIKSVSS